MTLETALRQAVEVLRSAGITVPQLTGEILLLHAIRADRAVLRAHPERELTDLQQLHFARYLHERLAGKPTQYITGHQEFWGLDIRVNPSVLIPRPETEHVVERALALAANAKLIVDCGTGSGCIAAALAHELPNAAIIATDISADALATAKTNAPGVPLVQADLLSCFADRSFDVVVSNPPYVSLGDQEILAHEVRNFEPAIALFAGEGGGAIYRRLIPEAARVLRPGGWAVVELGYNVAEIVGELFATPAWDSVGADPDLAGITRVMYARRV